MVFLNHLNFKDYQMNTNKMFPKMFSDTNDFNSLLEKVLSKTFPQLNVMSLNEATSRVKFPNTDSGLSMDILVDVRSYLGDLNVNVSGFSFEVKNLNVGALLDVAGSIYRTYLSTKHFLSTFVRNPVRKNKFVTALTGDNLDCFSRFDRTFLEFIVNTRFAEYCSEVPSHSSSIAFLNMVFKSKLDENLLDQSAINLMVNSVIDMVSISDPDIDTSVESYEPYIMELLKGTPNPEDNVLNALDSLPADRSVIENWVRENFNTVAETKEAMHNFYDLESNEYSPLAKAKTIPMIADFILEFIVNGEDAEEDGGGDEDLGEDGDFEQLKQSMWDLYNDLPSVWTMEHLQSFMAWSTESFESIEKLQNFLASVLHLSDLDHENLMSITSYEFCAIFAISALDAEDGDEDEEEDVSDLEDEDEDDEDYTEIELEIEAASAAMHYSLKEKYKKGRKADLQTACISEFFGNEEFWKLAFNIDSTNADNNMLMLESYLGSYRTECRVGRMIQSWMRDGF